MTRAETKPASPPRRLRLLRYPNLVIGAVMTVAVVLLGLAAPLLTSYDPYLQDLGSSLQLPSAAHLFGTDEFGRDLLTRVLYGARISLLEVTLSVSLALAVGLPLGVMAGYFGGVVDQIITWCADILYAFPGIVLAILIVSILGTNLINMLIAISVFAIPGYIRLTRSLTLALKELQYTEAALSLGASVPRIMFVHILRNALAPILVQATLTAGEVILSAAGLSFLGLGVQPPAAEWGAMMSEGRNYLGVATHLSLFPGLAITFTVLGLNLLGDGLRDRLDPRFRGRL
ncbi:ABC transporter permease [Deinococcus marmoris]|uniref:Dipeptide transport system permease protein DppC n=1 Tax=Deinococcus marmoris TaxID=249408 RepID=A0A1U7P3G2_9DEIO|nr:ABC transporter permease [Deinococcus marmoris]OLV19696.1 Dipeptide transport system permease protein DppC [Deinococcus marmoris]